MAKGTLEIRFAPPLAEEPLHAKDSNEGPEFLKAGIVLKGNFANVCVSSQGGISCLVFSDDEAAQRQAQSLETLQQLQLETVGKDIVFTFSNIEADLLVTQLKPQFCRLTAPAAYLRVNYVNTEVKRILADGSEDPLRWDESIRSDMPLPICARQYEVKVNVLPPIINVIDAPNGKPEDAYEVIELPESVV